MNMNPPRQHWRFLSCPTQFTRHAMALCWLLAIGEMLASAQTAFVNFNSPGQYTNDFNPWNDSSGSNGGSFSFMEDPSLGVGSGGGVSVFDSTDTTAVYKGKSWDFSTNGATLMVSVLVKANGQVSGNKVQLGILNQSANGLNNNAGVAFESFRVIPQDASTWSVREQYRTAGGLTETVLNNVQVAAGRWYKFVIGLTNTSGATGNYSAACDLLDYGTDGLTPGSSIVMFPTFQSHTNQDIAKTNAVWPALRAFQNAGIDAWDNFLVLTTNSPPLITWPLTNTTMVSGASASFSVLADGPGPLAYSWFTNGVRAVGGLSTTFAIPVATPAYSNLMVTVSNAAGSVSNSATITVLIPQIAVVANSPASGLGATTATLNGQVVNTGGDAPAVTFYYGTTDGGTNAGAWAESISAGKQSGTFAQTVLNLTPATPYFFTVAAQNSSGIAWASPTAKFSTLANSPAPAQVAVLTQHNDLARTGANLNETTLNIRNVTSSQFGQVFTRAVDDQIYAQPLIMTNVNVPGKGTHNVVIVATVNDSVYAFDADDGSVVTPYWHTSFLKPNVVAPRNTDMTGACGGGYQDFSGNMGIVGTPVIDPNTGTLYLVARTKESGSQFVQRLHALDVATGAERTNSPTVITATYTGNGDGNINNVITFDPQKQNQRPALTLANGIVYIAWSSHCDWGPYHGWIIGYDAKTLQREVVYNNTPNGYNGGIWMSGQGLSVDANGNLYLSVGNGSVGDNGNVADPTNRGESFLKLTRNGNRLAVASWFTPHNWQALENGDIDLGSAGLLLIPGTDLVFSGGKEGIAYLVHRDNMGGVSAGNTDTNIVQSFRVTSNQIHGGAVWWDGPASSYGYIWPSAVKLQQYRFDRTAGKFVLPAIAQSSDLAPAGQPGGILALSANGSTAGSGIVWASHQLTGDANQSVRPGILRAFQAENVQSELWNSEENHARDSVGNFAKFVPPTVANGRVYLATFSNRLNVYGLLAPPAPLLGVTRSGNNVVLSWPESAGANFRLQTTASLLPSNWIDATANPTSTNGTFQVTLPIAGTAAFYRLRD